MFPGELAPGMTYVPMADGDRAAFESSFAESIGAVDVAVRTVEVRGGSSSVGLRVVSMVLPGSVERRERSRVFAALDTLVPFSAPEQRRWGGNQVWVHGDDEVLSSSAVVVDGPRVIVVYGGLLEAERAVIELLDV